MRVGTVLLLFVVLCVAPVAAQDHTTFQVIRPLPVGAAGTGADADARWLRQPTGVDYTIRAEAIGGEWPYTWALSNEPPDMSIVTCLGPVSAAVRRTCGTITWTNPQATATDITVTATDQDGDTASQTWSITVSALSCGADGACFIDADCSGCDDTGSGTEASPYQTIDRIQTIGARAIVFLKGNGPFTLDNTTTQASECLHNGVSNTGTSALFTETSGPVIFIDYPEDGLRPIVNIGYTQGGAVKPCFEITGQNIWMNGIEIQNCPYKCVENQRSDEYGATYWNMIFRGTGIGQNGANSAAIMYAQRYSQNEYPYFDVVTQSEFYGIGGDGSGTISCIKNYSQEQSLVADNIFDGNSSSECLANKSDVRDFTDRNNRFRSMTGVAIGGNNHSEDHVTRGEILFNVCEDATSFCFEFNQDAGANVGVGPFYVYRNTFVGGIRHRGSVTGNGPFVFVRNVIVNNQAASGSCPAKFTCLSVTDYSVVQHTACGTGNCDLTAATADGIVEADGDLTGASLTTHGPDSAIPKGHMLDEAADVTPTKYRLRFRTAKLLVPGEHEQDRKGEQARRDDVIGWRARHVAMLPVPVGFHAWLLQRMDDARCGAGDQDQSEEPVHGGGYPAGSQWKAQDMRRASNRSQSFGRASGSKCATWVANDAYWDGVRSAVMRDHASVAGDDATPTEGVISMGAPEETDRTAGGTRDRRHGLYVASSRTYVLHTAARM